ncbi:MAG: SusC/RagA family TonB-linked outer membrane protein [Mangrovibacterium sp.]
MKINRIKLPDHYIGQLKKIYLVMKLTWLLILIICLHATASVWSQTNNISLRKNNTSLQELFNTIEDQSGYRFFYNNDEVDVSHKVTVNTSGQSIGEILTQAFKGLPYTFRELENKLILVERNFTQRASSSQQQRTITGKVTDSSGVPLPGVTVVVKGTNKGTITDAEGKYSIPHVLSDAILVFSFVGMKTQEVPVAEKVIINVSLEEETIGIEEVVAIGYGVANRKDLTGSISSVKTENSPQALFPNQNALDLLRGEVSGLDVGLVTQAGAEPSLLIRGQNSINGSNDPLIVLDGMIYTGSLGDINPDDIVSYDILKDAVSCAVYGSRSANGVIVITTKKGKTEKPVFTVNASTVLKKWQNRPNLMNGTQYLEIFNAKYRQPSTSTVNLTGSELENYENGIETDWLSLVTRTGIVQDYQIAVSGAAKKVNYYLSSSFDKTKGVIVGDDFNRISVLSKVDMDITDWFNIGLDINLSRRDFSGAAASLGDALTLSPWTDPYRNDQGDLEKYPRENSYVNPLWGVDDGTRDNKDISNLILLRGHTIVKVPWIKGLSYTLNYQNTIERQDVENFFYESYYVNEGAGIERYDPAEIQKKLVRASGYVQNQKTNAYIIDNILNYKRDFDKHRVDLTLVATRDKEKFYDVRIDGSDFTANGNTSLGVWGIHKATFITSDINSFVKTNIGYLGRLNYAYSDKYYISGSIRRDGASMFGKNKKWGTFSAVGLGWRISSEDFFKTDLINNLKIRLSWGQNGNQGIGPYTTLSTVQNGLSGGSVYEFSDSPGIYYYGLYQDRLGNASLGWETTESVNIGFESSWLKNRVFLDLDVYFSKTTDQLFDRRIPIMTGFNTMKASMGQVNNKGIEITAKTINVKNMDWEWQSSFYFWKNSNKLVHLYGEDLDLDGKEDDDIANNLFIGHSLGAIYGYEQDGIVQEDDSDYIELTGSSPGDAKYKDLDGVEGISTLDRKILGYTKPNYKISVGNTVTYKNWSLYVLLSGTFGANNYYLQSNKRAFSSATPVKIIRKWYLFTLLDTGK